MLVLPFHGQAATPSAFRSRRACSGTAVPAALRRLLGKLQKHLAEDAALAGQDIPNTKYGFFYKSTASAHGVLLLAHCRSFSLGRALFSCSRP